MILRRAAAAFDQARAGTALYCCIDVISELFLKRAINGTITTLFVVLLDDEKKGGNGLPFRATRPLSKAPHNKIWYAVVEESKDMSRVYLSGWTGLQSNRSSSFVTHAFSSPFRAGMNYDNFTLQVQYDNTVDYCSLHQKKWDK